MFVTIRNEYLGQGGGIPLRKLKPQRGCGEGAIMDVRMTIVSKGKEAALQLLMYLNEVGHIADDQLDKIFETYF